MTYTTTITEEIDSGTYNFANRCPICGKAIEDDDRVLWIDIGMTERIVHENCAVFKKEGLSWFMDMLLIDTNTGKARDFYD